MYVGDLQECMRARKESGRGKKTLPGAEEDMRAQG